MDPSFDPTPDASACDAELAAERLADEQAWRDTEKGLDARHAAQRKPKSTRNGKARPALPPARVALEIDLLPAIVSGGYAPRVVHELLLDTTAQRATLKLLTASLVAHSATLSDGTPVRRNETALQWLLEQIAIRLPSPTLDALMEGAAL